MSKDLPDFTPVRTMSGRRSKPSMDLLVDNQRVLSQYVTPKKDSGHETIKVTNIYPQTHSDNVTSSNQTETITIKLKKKRGPKPRQNKLLVKSKTSLYSSKIVRRKRKITPSIINESSSASTDDPQDELTHTPYVTLKLSKIDINDKSTESKKEDDDLPLAKVFPDFKPRTSETTIPEVQKRATLVLPPKKKIKFVNINELNGVYSKPLSVTPLKSVTVVGAPAVVSSVSPPSKPVEEKTIVVKLLSPSVAGATKIDILTMAKIPKKSKINGTSSSPSLSLPSPSSVVVTPKSPPSPDNIVLTQKPQSETTSLHDDGAPTMEPLQKEVPRTCVRDKCTNMAIDDFRWDREFCSPDCAILYSKHIVRDWLSRRQRPPPPQQMKMVVVDPDLRI